MKILCFFELHKYMPTTRQVLTFDADGHLAAAEYDTSKCKRCGEFENKAFDIEMGTLAARGV